MLLPNVKEETQVVLEPLRTSLYDGVVPIRVPKPKFNYLGPPMPLQLWQQVLSWFKTHDKGEVMIRFFVDFERGEWHAIPFPQHYPTGLSVKEIADHPLTPDTSRLVQFGSAHHHCSAAAFPSGTDDADEAKIEGIHLIVGNIQQEQMDLFLRLSVVVPGVLSGGQVVQPSRQAFIPEGMLDLTQWFSHEVVDQLPLALRPQVIRSYLSRYFGEVSYPKWWDDMLIPPPAHPFFVGKGLGQRKDKKDLYGELENLILSHDPKDQKDLEELVSYLQGENPVAPPLFFSLLKDHSLEQLQQVFHQFAADYGLGKVVSVMDGYGSED